MPLALSQGKILRVSCVYVFDADGRILLQQRGPNVLAPLLWNEAAAGHVDIGEEYIDTAIRELHEEVGLEVASQDLEEIDYYLHEHYDDKGKVSARRFHKVYKLKLDDNREIDHKDEEVAGFRWVTQDDLIHELQSKPQSFTSSFIFGISRYFEDLQINSD